MKDDDIEAHADLEDKLDAGLAKLEQPRARSKAKPVTEPSHAGTLTFLRIALKDILPSPFNHRKVFNGIDELAESIRGKGVINPITVRPAPTPRSHPPYELVAGERRYRACKVAGLDDIPCIVRTLSDKEVLEVQLIENVQRVDVHPLEEADGYQDLIKKHGYDVDTIAAKTGKSRAAVYARLKLCDLAPAPRKAFLENKLNPSVALMIARIPDAKLQAQATTEVLGEGDWKDYEGVRRAELQGDDGMGRVVGDALSVRAAQIHLQRKYMLRLDQAPFDITNADLHSVNGACTTCRHRTGNQSELFADVKSADVCTMPSCFEEKKAADWMRKSTSAKAAGVRVLTDKETKSVFEQYGDGTRITHSAAYVDPNDDLPYDLNPSGKKKTWKSLLGKATPATVVARDGKSQARTLWDRQSAIATARKSGALKEVKAAAAARSSSPDNDAWKERQRKAAAAAKQRHAVGRAILGQLASDKYDPKDPEVWRFVATGVVRMLDSEDCRNLCKRRELDCEMGSGKAEKALQAIVKAAPATGLPALVVEFIAAFRGIGGLWAGATGFGENFRGACDAFGIDIAKVKTKIAAEEKAKKKPAKKKST